ncbi:MAG: hypothetical protein LZ167_04670 [Thaumarchaeota archaeon]|jgi:hypothetical protein|nr:hypothetical protein [Candidatus Geocrenenecus arthurdayi]MCL7396683.1 hypothetical protein [Candidatus Geocrenenecus arthurdayi]
MAVRIKLKLKPRTSEEAVVASALINSGFETDSPQLLIPVELARRLVLYPPPITSSIIEVGTAGGPSRVLLVREALEVWAVTDDREVGPKLVDVLISLIEEEVLVNDKLTEELGIILLAAGSGKWRFIDDPADKVRYSEKPQYW